MLISTMVPHIFLLGLYFAFTSGNKTHHALQQENNTNFNFPNIVSDGEITATISQEKRLLRFLMKRYRLVGKTGPPVLNSSKPVTVKFALALIKLELDEKTKMLVTSMWTRHIWHDDYMVCIHSVSEETHHEYPGFPCHIKRVNGFFLC